MIELDKRLKETGLQATMLLQVHDELVFEVPEKELESLDKLVKEVMEQAVSLHVPLITDSSWGKRGTKQNKYCLRQSNIMKVKRKMPELPEVETVRKGLERLVVGKRFRKCKSCGPRSSSNQRRPSLRLLLLAKPSNPLDVEGSF